MAVPLDGIVEHCDKIKYLGFGFSACRVDFSLGYALFKGLKEAHGNRIVMAVTLAAHGQ